MHCAESMRVQAHFDGELDAISSFNVEQHIEHCPECRQWLQSLEHTRTRLRAQLPPFCAPPELRARIHHVLDVEEASGGTPRALPARRVWRLPTFWWGSLAGASAMLIAGAVGFVALLLPAANPVVDAVLQAHVRSLMSAHLTDVVSTDRHTVKPWFAGRAAVSPAVADFAAQGYTLTGGRVEDLEQQHAAVMVYRHGAHLINVFCWIAPHRPLPRDTTRQGYHMAFWRSGDLAYAAVSDMGWEELSALESLLKGLAAADDPPGKSGLPGE